MKKFIILNYGFVPPSPEVMEKWMAWFESLAERVVDPGSPFGKGKEITHQFTTDLSPTKGGATGYMIIHAESMEEAVEVAKAAPFIDYIRVYECMPPKEL